MKRKEQTENTRKLIVGSAMRIFGEKDFNLASISDISKNAEISKGIIYHYFENKEMLYLECVRMSIDGLSSYLEKFSIKTSCVESNFLDYINYRHQFFVDNPDLKNVFFNSMLKNTHNLSKEIALMKENLDKINLLFLEEMISHVELRAEITKDDALQIFILLQNAGINSISDSGKRYSPDEFMVEQEKFIRKSIKIMFYGIGVEKKC